MNISFLPQWFLWAFAAAVFAALTAIFAKMGLKNIDSDYATFIRTVVILFALSAFLSYTGKWQNPTTLSFSRFKFSN